MNWTALFERRHTSGRPRAEASVPSEVGGADQPRTVAQPGAAYLERGPIAAARQMVSEGSSGRAEQQLIGGAHSAADHDHRRVEHRGKGCDALTEPPAH